MVRGLFENRSVRNLLAPDLAPGTTVHSPSGRRMSLREAARAYGEEGRRFVILAGDRYGMGSSRDWAAQGVALLGVSAVLACSFERIHRTNLVAMGVLPLLLPRARHPPTLGLSAADRREVEDSAGGLAPAVRLRGGCSG